MPVDLWLTVSYPRVLKPGWNSLASESGSKTHGAIASFYFHAERAQDVDSPAGAGSSVFLPSRHWGGDGCINQPRRAALGRAIGGD